MVLSNLLLLKRFFKNNFIFILLFSFKFCLNNECKVTSYMDLHYVKALTLENGYHLMVTQSGIYSYLPGLSSFSYNYNFTSNQTLNGNIDSMENNINQVEISQFSKEEGGNAYIVCLAKNYIYFMDEKGEILINEKLSDFGASNTISLTAYKYYNNEYYFIIAYNIVSKSEYCYCLSLNYYNIVFESNKYMVKDLVSSKNFFPKIN